MLIASEMAWRRSRIEGVQCKATVFCREDGREKGRSNNGSAKRSLAQAGGDRRDVPLNSGLHFSRWRHQHSWLGVEDGRNFPPSIGRSRFDVLRKGAGGLQDSIGPRSRFSVPIRHNLGRLHSEPRSFRRDVTTTACGWRRTA